MSICSWMPSVSRRSWWPAMATVLAMVATQVVLAADISVDALANYEGADRSQRLLEGAKKEGVLNLYTSLTVEDMTVLNAAFEKTYGIKVRMWRASCDKVLQRVLAEYQAGRAEVDIVECNAPPLEAMHREGVLQAVRSPWQADLIPPRFRHIANGWARASMFSCRPTTPDW